MVWRNSFARRGAIRPTTLRPRLAAPFPTQLEALPISIVERINFVHPCRINRAKDRESWRIETGVVGVINENVRREANGTIAWIRTIRCIARPVRLTWCRCIHRERDGAAHIPWWCNGPSCIRICDGIPQRIDDRVFVEQERRRRRRRRRRKERES